MQEEQRYFFPEAIKPVWVVCLVFVAGKSLLRLCVRAKSGFTSHSCSCTV